MLALIILWLAAVGTSFLITLGIVFYQYRKFLTSITLADVETPPTFRDYLSYRITDIANQIANS